MYGGSIVYCRLKSNANNLLTMIKQLHFSFHIVHVRPQKNERMITELLEVGGGKHSVLVR